MYRDLGEKGGKSVTPESLECPFHGFADFLGTGSPTVIQGAFIGNFGPPSIADGPARGICL
ncbi:hypothetical protein N7471_000895 [Penicillium samsonianum]|uniref:uncharacterized protein n=1 Tax=Penicillium samsonianum TaxID=1882272 RepID=UPI0025482CB4|nr:uncharacterized protein N7471_000895 [Penicillium samsonianum]KAJ6149696.1 hypothetical protein N7471_000895 [Penicillium samsonianum]